MTSFASEIGHVVSDYKNKFVNKTYTDADIDSFKTLYSAYIMALKASANLSYAAAKSKQQKMLSTRSAPLWATILPMINISTAAL